MQEHHETALAGHLGQAKTFDLLDRQYYWKDIRKQVDQYVRNCHSCQRSRTSRHAMFGVLRPLSLPEKPWEDISMDFVVGLLECEGFDAVWVVVDRLSKMRHFIPCHTMIDAVGLAKLFLGEVLRLPGLRRTIVWDWGHQFALTFWGQICSRLGVDRRISTAFHPQMDGQTKRINAAMEQYLRIFFNHQQDDWVQWLPLAEFAANSGISEAAKCSPVFCNSGLGSTNVICRRTNYGMGSRTPGCGPRSGYDARTSWIRTGGNETKSSTTGRRCEWRTYTGTKYTSRI